MKVKCQRIKIKRKSYKKTHATDFESLVVIDLIKYSI